MRFASRGLFILGWHDSYIVQLSRSLQREFENTVIHFEEQEESYRVVRLPCEAPHFARGIRTKRATSPKSASASTQEAPGMIMCDEVPNFRSLNWVCIQL